ncbi:MAG TPA: hypothetical protein VIU12_24160 [Chryseolinea sp.]
MKKCSCGKIHEDHAVLCDCGAVVISYAEVATRLRVGEATTFEPLTSTRSCRTSCDETTQSNFIAEAKEFYYKDSGNGSGPCSSEEMWELYKASYITLDTPIRHKETLDSKRFADAFESFCPPQAYEKLLADESDIHDMSRDSCELCGLKRPYTFVNACRPQFVSEASSEIKKDDENDVVFLPATPYCPKPFWPDSNGKTAIYIIAAIALPTLVWLVAMYAPDVAFVLFAVLSAVSIVATGMYLHAIFGARVWIACGIALFILLIIIGNNGGDSSRTDGVFESAMEKMDKGIPLNTRESQRIDDIWNYTQNKEADRIEKKYGER